MRDIHVCKYQVRSNFPGFYYPVFSLVILRENNRNTLGRIVGYDGNDKVIVQSKSGKRHNLKYSDVVFYEDPHEPAMTLKEVERLARKYADYYSQEANLVTIAGQDYLIDNKVDIVFDTDRVYDHPGALMAVCMREDYSGYEFNLLIPFLQYANKKQIKKLILHEVAHLIAKPYHDHDNLWYAICKTIGGDTRELVPISETAIANIKEFKMPADWTETFEGVDTKLWTKVMELSLSTNLARMGLVLNETKILPDYGFYGTAHEMGIHFESKLRFFGMLNEIPDEVMHEVSPRHTINILNKYVAELITLGSNKDIRDNLEENDRKFVESGLLKLHKIKKILRSEFKDFL